MRDVAPAGDSAPASLPTAAMEAIRVPAILLPKSSDAVVFAKPVPARRWRQAIEKSRVVNRAGEGGRARAAGPGQNLPGCLLPVNLNRPASAVAGSVPGQGA